MKVKDLIKELQKIDNQEARVITKDYGGVGRGYLGTGFVTQVREDIVFINDYDRDFLTWELKELIESLESDEQYD